MKKDAIKAHAAVHYAIKKGQLSPITDNTKCVDCGLPAEHYDHRYYGKPLEVEPVCRICNIRRGPAKGYFRVHITTKTRRNMFIEDLQWKALLSLAQKTGLSVAELIRHAIDQYLEKKK